MVESYLHKMAKELLYKEIEEKSGFEFKNNCLSDCYDVIFKTDNKDIFFVPLIERDDYRNECVLMEFPSIDGGYYPDELGCHNTTCHKKTGKYRFNTGSGYCKCGSCEHLNLQNTIIHDIAAFWKGNIRWAIEIVNKHEPDWNDSNLDYPVFLVRAEDVLKRVSKSPVYVYKLMGTGWFDYNVKIPGSDLFD